MKRKSLIGLIAAAMVSISVSGCGNKDLWDTVYTYDYAIIQLQNGEVVEGKVEKWSDYEDGDQIQVTIDGKTYTFDDDKKNTTEIALMHPMSEEHAVLRKGLVPSIIDVACYNSARKITDLALFEIGSRYYMENEETKEEAVLSGLFSGTFNGNTWRGGKEKVDFYLVKGVLENLFDHLGLTVKFQKMNNADSHLHPGRCAEIKFQNEVIGYVSSLHPAYTHELGLIDTYIFEIVLTKILNAKSTITKFQSIVKKPTVVRDLALVMEKTVSVGDLIETIQRTSKDMISKVEVFDLYESAQLGSKKSVAISIYFESDNNLTDEVINEKVNKILEMAETKFKATLRS